MEDAALEDVRSELTRLADLVPHVPPALSRHRSPLAPVAPVPRGPPHARANGPDVGVPDGQPMEAFKLKVGKYFKVMYYGLDTPFGKERTVLVKKLTSDSCFVNIDNSTDLKLILSRRVGRVDPIAIDTSRPLTRSMHCAMFQ